jgi:AraC-like DNA-binding protein
VSESRRDIGEMRHPAGPSCNPGAASGILRSAAGTSGPPGGDPISYVSTEAPGPALRLLRSAATFTQGGDRPPPLDRVRVGVCVASDWAGRAVCRALRDAGAVPVPVESSAITPRALAGSAALVYDLNPWTPTAADRFAGLVDGRPVLLYLPPNGPAFTTYSRLPKAGDIRVQVQSRDADSMAHLREAAVDLVRAVPRVWIMDDLKRAVPNLSSAAYLFGHRALGVLGAGRRPSVAALARALGLSRRTLERRFLADGLPTPKALLDRLTLEHLRHVSGVQQRSLSRVATDLGLTANDLYRLRKRVSHRWERVEGERLTSQAVELPSGRSLDFHPASHGLEWASAGSLG